MRAPFDASLVSSSLSLRKRGAMMMMPMRHQKKRYRPSTHTLCIARKVTSGLRSLHTSKIYLSPADSFGSLKHRATRNLGGMQSNFGACVGVALQSEARIRNPRKRDEHESGFVAQLEKRIDLEYGVETRGSVRPSVYISLPLKAASGRHGAAKGTRVDASE